MTTQKFSTSIKVLLLLIVGAAPAVAEPTRELSVSGPKEVFAGDPESSSVDAQGQVSMGPTVVDLAQGTDHPIVTMAPAPNGGLYAGTAGGGLLSIDAGGRTTRLFDAQKESVSAIVRLNGTLYVATIPEGRILRVDGKDKTTPINKPAAKYVWSLVADGKNLLVATGSPGQVLRVFPNGKSEVVFDPKETHIRALIRDPQRGIVAGGGQKGIVYQISGKKAFALYDSTMDEVTAFASDPKSGALYASFVSESKDGTIDPSKWIGPVKGDEKDDGTPVKGSEVVRITKDGQVQKLWSSKTEGAMDLTFDAASGRLFFVTATAPKNRSRVYAVDTKDRDRLLLFASLEPPIATSIILAPTGGALFVGTAPAGRVVRLGPGLRTNSTYLSAEQDLVRISDVGRVWFDADVPTGAKVEVSLRSGNTAKQDDTWSGWSGSVSSKDGGNVDLPRGKYVQFRAVLSANGRGRAPLLKSLHASVVRINVAPNVEEVFMLRRGVYMASMPRESEQEKTVTLSTSVIRDLRKAAKKKDRVRVRQGERTGMMTVVWSAKDPNHDDLLFRVEMRRLEPPDMAYKVVANDIEEAYWSFDSRTHPDGRYRFRVTASDRPSNPPSDAKSDRFESEPFVIDNGAPKITNLKASSPRGGQLRIEADAEDDTTAIGFAEVAVGGGPWLMLPAKDGLIDAPKESLGVDIDSSDEVGGQKIEPGTKTVLVRVEDEAGNESTASTTVRVR